MRNVSLKTFAKGDILIPEGCSSKHIFYVRKGLIRSYFSNDKSEDVTFQLYPETQFVANVHSILFHEPSRFIYQATEPSRVYSFEYDTYYQFLAKNPELLDLNRKYMSQRIMKQAYQRIETLLLLNPEGRYLKLITDYPGLVNRVPDKYIANVLGITPVSLSRIRRRIATKRTN